MRQTHKRAKWLRQSTVLTLAGLGFLGISGTGLSGCASEPDFKPGQPLSYVEREGAIKLISFPDWARLRPPPGTELSPDEIYLQTKGWDLAAPKDESIPFMRRPVYVTETGMKLGPKMEIYEIYYVTHSYQWHATEEGRVNVLLDDLYRANARAGAYLTVVERVFAREEARIEAIYEGGYEAAGPHVVQNLLIHTIIARNSLQVAAAPLEDRLKAYAWAAKRARLDLPGDPQLFAVDAEVATLSTYHATLRSRLDALDQQITDLMTASALATETASEEH